MFNYTLFLAAISCSCAALIPFNYSSRYLLVRQVKPTTSPPLAGYVAGGVTPETPFKLPTETTTLQPDVSYLPPPDNTYGPSAGEEKKHPELAYGPPQTTYGLPESAPQPADGETTPADDVEDDEVFIKLDDGSVVAVSTSFDSRGLVTASETDEQAALVQPAQLVYQRFPQARRRTPTTTEETAAAFVPARLQLPLIVPHVTKPVLPQGFTYTSRFESW